MTLSELPQSQSVQPPSLFDRPVEQYSSWPAHITPTSTHCHSSHYPNPVEPIFSRLRRSDGGV
jgi:hypothetical protein